MRYVKQRKWNARKKDRQADAMVLLPKTDAGKTHAGKPQSSGDTH